MKHASTVAVVGAGKIGEVLLAGLRRSGWPAERLLATARRAERATELTERGQELGLVDPTLDAAALAMLTQVVRLGLALWDISGDAAPTPEAWADLLDRLAAALMTTQD